MLCDEDLAIGQVGGADCDGHIHVQNSAIASHLGAGKRSYTDEALLRYFQDDYFFPWSK